MFPGSPFPTSVFEGQRYSQECPMYVNPSQSISTYSLGGGSMETEELETVNLTYILLIGWQNIENWPGWKGIWSPWTVKAHRRDLLKYHVVIGPIPLGRPCARQKHCYISYPVLLMDFICRIYPDLNRRKKT
jgi:hypothetical protein